MDPHPPPRNANNIEHYTFVTLFPGKSDTPHPHLRYVTLEWPLTPFSSIGVLKTFALRHHHVTSSNQNSVNLFSSWYFSALLLLLSFASSIRRIYPLIICQSIGVTEARQPLLRTDVLSSLNVLHYGCCLLSRSGATREKTAPRNHRRQLPWKCPARQATHRRLDWPP